MAHQALNKTGKKIVILGGGLSGLSFAHYLRNFLAYYKKSDKIRKIVLMEANDYMGGSVKSAVFEDDIVHELGPRSIRAIPTKAQNTCVLVEQLGLADKVLTITPKDAPGKDRYVYMEGKMWSVPSSPLQLFKRLPASDRRLWHIVYKDYMRNTVDLSKYPYNDPSLYEFVKERFGEVAAESVLDPMLRGITAGDCRAWSTKGMFKELLEREQRFGGIVRGMFAPASSQTEHDELYANDIVNSQLLKDFKKNDVASFSLSTGLRSLPEHLTNSLLNSNDDDVMAIYNKTRASSIQFNNEVDATSSPCSITVETVDGDKVKIDGDHIIAALPAKDFSQILSSSDSIIPSGDKSEALDYIHKIEHAPVGCVTVEFRDLNTKLPAISKSFGFLTHSRANSRLLGVAFDSASFPAIDRDTGAFRMTCMMGGAWAQQIFGTSDMDKVTHAQMEQIALEELRSILKIKQEPYRMSSILWKTGIAQYYPGHLDKLEQTRDNIAKCKLPLTLLGQSYDGIAVNDVIYSARVAASEFVKSL